MFFVFFGLFVLPMALVIGGSTSKPLIDFAALWAVMRGGLRMGARSHIFGLRIYLSLGHGRSGMGRGKVVKFLGKQACFGSGRAERDAALGDKKSAGILRMPAAVFFWGGEPEVQDGRRQAPKAPARAGTRSSAPARAAEGSGTAAISSSSVGLKVLGGGSSFSTTVKPVMTAWPA